MPCCLYCLKETTDKGHDACIADLPGVKNACCGHGGLQSDGLPKHLQIEEKSLPYVQFEDGRKCTLYGKIAIEEMKRLGGDPPPVGWWGSRLSYKRYHGRFIDVP